MTTHTGTGAARPVRKRWLVAVPKPGMLVARYGRPSRGDSLQVCYAWGGGGADKSDGRILSNALEGAHVQQGRTLCEELEARGYDITTLRFSIERLPVTPDAPTADQPRGGGLSSNMETAR